MKQSRDELKELGHPLLRERAILTVLIMIRYSIFNPNSRNSEHVH